jgi:hypothetical protein
VGTAPTVTAETTPTVEPPAPGPVVTAVLADLESMGDLRGRRALAAAALAMGRILDHPNLATTQPSAAKQLDSLMTSLHKRAAPQRGRLAAVQTKSRA